MVHHQTSKDKRSNWDEGRNDEKENNLRRENPHGSEDSYGNVMGGMVSPNQDDGRA